MRGGSWNNNHNNARCAVRNNNQPDNHNNNIGFRVMVAMFIRPSSGMAKKNAARRSTPQPGLGRYKNACRLWLAG